MNQLNEIIPELIFDGLWQIAVVFFRIGAFVSVLPGFGDRNVPGRVKLAIVIAFSLIVSLALDPDSNLQTDRGLIWLIFAETANGLLLGIGIRLFILALETAGSIAAQSTSLSQLLGGAATEPIPAMGYVLVYAAIALAMALGLHIKAAALLIQSYAVFPIGVFPSPASVAQWGVAQVRDAFLLAFRLAAPFVILSLLYNLALGAINKAMPQLMVSFVGAPVITAGGLLVLAIASPLLLSVWLGALDGYMANPLGQRP